MADLIDRAALLKEFEENGWLEDTTVADIVEEAPAVDAVPVVRCKDCKWFNNAGCAIRIVDDSDKPKEMDFCSFGERKDNG